MTTQATPTPVPLGERAFRAGARLTSQVHPRLAGDMALRHFCSPGRLAPRRWERDGLESSQEIELRGHPWALDPRPLAALRWEANAASRGSVLMLHGWGGRSSHFAVIGPAMAAAGWNAVALDLPAHGSSPGRQTHLHDMVLAVRAAAHQLGDVRAVVAHSFGGAVATVAMARGLDGVGASVFLASPSDLLGLLKRGVARTGLGARATEHLFGELRRMVGKPLEQLQPLSLAPQIESPLLMLHDPQDPEVSIAESRALAKVWRHSALEPVPGVGHWRVLREEGIVERVNDFLDTTLP